VTHFANIRLVTFSADAGMFVAQWLTVARPGKALAL
jgi:hypothetical protein